MKTLYKSYFLLIAMSLLLSYTSTCKAALVPRGKGRLVQVVNRRLPERENYDTFIRNAQLAVQRADQQAEDQIEAIQHNQAAMMDRLRGSANTIKIDAEDALRNLNIIERGFAQFLTNLDHEFDQIEATREQYFQLGLINQEQMEIFQASINQLYTMKNRLETAYLAFNDAALVEKIRMIEHLQQQQHQLTEATGRIAAEITRAGAQQTGAPRPTGVATAPAHSTVTPQGRQPLPTHTSPSVSPQGGASSSNSSGNLRHDSLLPSSSASSLHLSPTNSSDGSFSGAPLGRDSTQLFGDDSDSYGSLFNNLVSSAAPHSSSSDVTSTATSSTTPSSRRPLHQAVVEHRDQQAKTRQRARSNWRRLSTGAIAQAGQFNTATDFGITPSSQFATAVSKTVANQKQAQAGQKHVTVTSPLHRTGSFSGAATQHRNPIASWVTTQRKHTPSTTTEVTPITTTATLKRVPYLDPAREATSRARAEQTSQQARRNAEEIYRRVAPEFLPHATAPSSRTSSPAPTSSSGLSAAEEYAKQKRHEAALAAVREYSALSKR